jgi:hypothetical protein
VVIRESLQREGNTRARYVRRCDVRRRHYRRKKVRMGSQRAWIAVENGWELLDGLLGIAGETPQ